MTFKSIGHETLSAALSHCEAEYKIHKANLRIYLANPVGVGEHPNIVQEVVDLTKKISEAEENIKTLKNLIDEWTQSEKS